MLLVPTSLAPGLLMGLELIAFIDESCKPMRDRGTKRVAGTGEYHYVLAAAVALDGDHIDIRERLGLVRERIGRQLHYRDLSRANRMLALQAIDAIHSWEGYLFETARPLLPRNYSEHHVRAKLLEVALIRVEDRGVSRVVIETRSRPATGFVELDQKDRDVLKRVRRQKGVTARLEIMHATKSEPILQMADLLAGARSDWLCGLEAEAFARITHRVRSIESAFGSGA